MLAEYFLGRPRNTHEILEQLLVTYHSSCRIRKKKEMRKKRLETGKPRCCDCSLLEPPKKSSALSSCVRLVAGSKTRVAEGGRRKARGNWNTSRIPPLPPFVAWEAILKKTTINKTYWEWKLYYLSDNGRQSRLGNCRPSTALFSLIPPSAKARVQQLCYGRKG